MQSTSIPRRRLPTLPDPLFRLLRLLLAAVMTVILLLQCGIGLSGQWPHLAVTMLALLVFLQIAHLLEQLDSWYMEHASKPPSPAT